MSGLVHFHGEHSQSIQMLLCVMEFLSEAQILLKVESVVMNEMGVLEVVLHDEPGQSQQTTASSELLLV